MGINKKLGKLTAFLNKFISKESTSEEIIKDIIGSQKLRYLFFGSCNVVLSWIIYFVCIHFITFKENVVLFERITISPHIFSLLISFVITFFSGFFLNHFLVFRSPDSPDLWRKLGKYLIANMGSLILNYVLLKFFVEVLFFYPTPSQILCTFLVTIYSFLMQKKFTFKNKPVSSE
ncbi:GtrA family protein [Sphingobacterium faecale]|uniref:GtrA family protein n=1 Tax=Sphingobacterium faecale TaxID=2803775 RepID=A0ABS1R3F7_9SPHI|nr:GtrA family protein [Sphingobacterium faecale]